jgi:hypothetical protein
MLTCQPPSTVTRRLPGFRPCPDAGPDPRPCSDSSAVRSHCADLLIRARPRAVGCVEGSRGGGTAHTSTTTEHRGEHRRGRAIKSHSCHQSFLGVFHTPRVVKTNTLVRWPSKARRCVVDRGQYQATTNLRRCAPPTRAQSHPERMRRVGPTHTCAQNDCGRNPPICRQNDVATSHLLGTESAQDRVAPGRYRPGAPTDPYVRALAHTVRPITAWLRT